MLDDPRALLTDLFKAALAAADPAVRLPPHLPSPPKGRTVVVGAGKAAAAMAAAVEAHWSGPLDGLVIVPRGYGVPTAKIGIVEASHPVPDIHGFRAATQILQRVEGLSEDDLVLVLLSGGGSALMTLPAGGLSLEDKRQVTQSLLMCGAPIDDINCVRKHLSAIKAGRLAIAAWPARVHTLVVSDVVGDDPALIASGPTVGDPSTTQDALEVIRRHRLEIPFSVIQFLRRTAGETPKPNDPRLQRSTIAVIARPADALAAAADRARALGVTPINLGDSIEGESREVARAMAGMARSAARIGQPASPPCVILSGGETTVTVQHRGRGGPNTEFALSLAIALDGHPGVAALACDTDGADGASGAAGAFAFPNTLGHARSAGLDPQSSLARNDSATCFDAIGGLMITGPTRTNVNDFRAILVTGTLPPENPLAPPPANPHDEALT